MNAVPKIRLADGHDMPQLGFGVWQVDNDEVENPVKVALQSGYRLIDTAEGYGNEEGVGRALASSGVERGEIFLTTKLNNPRHGYDEALRACDDSLARLGTDYLDLYLIDRPAHCASPSLEPCRSTAARHRTGWRQPIRQFGRKKCDRACGAPVAARRMADIVGGRR